jgi:hypothetical protein
VGLAVILREPDASWGRREHEGPERLAATLDARVEQFACARIPQSGVVLPHCIDLRRRQAVRREMPETRQKAGTVTAAPSGGVNLPAGTGVANVTVVLFGSSRLARLPQVCAAGADVDVRPAAPSTIKTTERFIWSVSG